MKIRDLIFCSVFCALIIVGAFIRIAIPPLPIVFTMQTFFVLLSSYVLGSKSVISVGIYILLGLIGFPIFASGGGIGYIFTPSFGYLLGFLIGAYVCGKLIENKKLSILPSMIALAIIYAVGALYFYLIKNIYLAQSISVWTVLISCVFVFLPFDLICACFVYVLTKRLKKTEII